MEEMVKNIFTEIQNKLIRIVESHLYKGNCTKKGQFSSLKNVSIRYSTFLKIWKIPKISIVGRPIVASYNWISTPASIIVGHYLKKNYSKFENILTDSLSLMKL